jgi:hypothetical protein
VQKYEANEIDIKLTVSVQYSVRRATASIMHDDTQRYRRVIAKVARVSQFDRLRRLPLWAIFAAHTRLRQVILSYYILTIQHSQGWSGRLTIALRARRTPSWQGCD